MSHKKTLYKPDIVGAYMNMICSFDSTRTTKLVKKAREAYNAESENEMDNLIQELDFELSVCRSGKVDSPEMKKKLSELTEMLF